MKLIKSSNKGVDKEVDDGIEGDPEVKIHSNRIKFPVNTKQVKKKGGKRSKTCQR